jgi:glycosyltransferase involved in cell wall biosynthesis
VGLTRVDRRDRQMKIAAIGIKGIPACFGGFETVVEELSTGLVERGHQVTVYNRTNNISFKEKYYKGIKLVRLPTLHSKNFSTIFHAFLSTLYVLFTDVDIVHFYTTGTTIFAPLPRLFGMKTVCSVDGFDWKRKKWGRLASLYIRLSEYFASKFTDVLIADAEVIKEYYLERYNTPSAMIRYGAKIEESRNPGWIKRFDLERERYILFVGRLVPENNIHYLIEAFEKVKTEKKLVIVGDDPWLNKYITSLKSTGDPRVIFTGGVYGDGYRELNCNAYLFVLPDEVGGTHPALIEAMAFGNCVLVNDTPANLEVIEDAGLSYRGKEGSRDLTAKLQYLVDNPDIVEGYREKAVRRIEESFQWDQIIEEHEKLYYRLLNR